MTADEIAALRWKVVRGKYGFAIVDTDGGFVTQDALGRGAFSFEEHAQIASAAPALFAALRDLRRWCIIGNNWTDETGRMLLANADAALAEAARNDTADGGSR